MADKQRFELFARFLAERFSAPRVYDIAGGMGRLNEELSRLGRTVTTFDSRHKHLEVRYETRELSLNEPCHCDLIVGLHPDGATRVIIEYAAKNQIPFAIVPCCSDNSMSYKPWMRFLSNLARDFGFQVEIIHLAMTGRAAVIVGIPPIETGT